MPAPRHDDDKERPADTWAPRARQWSHAALALAVLFASWPISSRLLLGSWGFDGASGLAALCLVAAAYLHLAGRESRGPSPDPAAILNQAIWLAESGDIGGGIALLNEALRLSPRFWQARQYRGQIRLDQPGAAGSALQDFTEAIHLAPTEPDLYVLRSRAHALLGRESDALADLDAAARLQAEAGASPVNIR